MIHPLSFLKKNGKIKHILPLIFLVALIFSFLPYPAHAGFFDGIKNFFGDVWDGITHAAGDAVKSTANFILSGLVTIIFTILAAIGVALMSLAEGLFTWVTSPGFIHWSGSNYTVYINNPVVNLGWGIVRDFTNLLFVMGLVIIGLTTIIGYKDYEAKKTLPLLIGVAILINFTPLICGIIIDGADIVMNFFFDNGGRVISHDWFSTLSNQFGNVVKGEWFSADLSGLGERIGKALMYLAFDYISALVFLLYAFLFLARYVVLWLLIIISPLAFFAYIFPASRNYFHQWWHTFVQWAIIGIIPAFLLFLANAFMSSGAEIGEAGTEQLAAAGFMTGILIFFVPTVLLLLGLYFALNTSAVGASIITGGFQKHVVGRARKYARKYGTLAGKKAVKGAGRATLGGLRGAITGAKEARGIRARFKGAITGAAKGGLTREGREKGAVAAGKALEWARLRKPGTTERKEREKIENEKKALQSLSNEELHKIAKRRGVTTQDIISKIASIEELAKRGKLSREEVEELIQKPQKLKTLLTYGLNPSDIIKNYPVEKVVSAFNTTPEETLSKMTPKEAAEKIRLDQLEKDELEPVLRHLDTSQINEISKKASPSAKRVLSDYVINRIGELSEKYTGEKININPNIPSSVKEHAFELDKMLEGMKDKIEELKEAGAPEQSIKEMENLRKNLIAMINKMGEHYYD